MRCINLIHVFIVSLLLLTALAVDAAEQKPEVTVKSLLEKEDKGDEKEQAAEKKEEVKAEVKKAAVVSAISNEDQLAIQSLPHDEYNRVTPSSAMQSYLKAARKRDFARATHYLDYRNLPPEVAAIDEALLAEQLSLVLDRTLWIDVDTLSNHPDGKKEESVPSYRDLVGEIKTSRGPVQVLLQHVPSDKSGQMIWKISNATVSNIPFLTQEFGYNAIGEWLYNHMPKVEFLGVMAWQWVYFSVSFALYIIVALLITRLLAMLVHKFKPAVAPDVLSFIKGPFCLLLAVLLSRTFYDDANVTIAVVALVQGSTILLIAWTWVFIRLVDIIKHRLTTRFYQQDKPQAVFLLRPASNVAKTLIVIIAILLWFENLGFNATTLLAGLGIGGLAIALAAQKTVENIIGAITLYISAPVRIGSLCKFGNQVGTIEEIGLRATRIRTLDRSVIYVANAKFVDMQLENISERERISYRPNLMLSAKTKQTDLQAFMTACKDLLEGHDKIAKDPCRVKFKGFTPWALQIDVLSYVNTTDFAEYMEIIEALNMAILGLLNEHNCELANPEFARISA